MYERFKFQLVVDNNLGMENAPVDGAQSPEVQTT